MIHRLLCIAYFFASVGCVPYSMAAAPPGKANLAFAQVSMRPSKDFYGQGTSNLPLGPGENDARTDGRFYARRYDLLSYIGFAYELTPPQRKALMKQAPSWAGFDRYDIDAQSSDPTATKEQLREMVRTLLAQKFQLALHEEMRTGTVYALRLIAGRTGPELKPHPPGQPCSMALQLPAGTGIRRQKQTGGVITAGPCGGIGKYSGRYGAVLAGRDVPISLIANALSCLEDGEPMIDETGLSGHYDFTLEYSYQPVRRFGGAGSGTEISDLTAELPDPADEQNEPPSPPKALQSQLGMKLVKQRGETVVWVVDRVVRPPKR